MYIADTLSRNYDELEFGKENDDEIVALSEIEKEIENIN